MNKNQTYQLLAVIAIFAAISYVAITSEQIQPASRPEMVFKENRADFKAGEILLPDYAHDDTLIVVNPDGLNAEIEMCDGSDGDISAVLHRYCAVLGQTMPEYGIDVDNEGYWLHDYAYNKDSVRGIWDKTNFDSLIYKWND